MIEYRREYTIGTIHAVHCRYASGLHEIGFFGPEVLKGAGRVFLAVADKMPGNRVFFIHGKRDREARARTIKQAIALGAIAAERRINSGE